MAQTTHTHSVGFGDGNVNSGNIKDSFNTTFYKPDEDAQITHWLSPLEPNKRHQGVRNDRLGGVGDWLLETSEFREWRGGEGGGATAVLFCSGNPGVGKTYLCSLVIDRLCDQARGENLAVAWLYCDFLAQQEQTTANVMGAILGQLVGRGDIPKDVQEEFQQAKKVGGRRPLLADLMRMLRTAVASLPQVFVCIDALDEFLPKNLPELLESLRDIARESPRVRIFLTGRSHVKESIQRYFPKALAIPISPNQGDIRNYLEMKLDRDEDSDAMNKDLRADIVRTILEKMSDIFLLVSLNIDAILGEMTIRQRRKKLEVMSRGNGLSDAYMATLTRLKAQKGNKPVFGLKVLMWVVHSQRPLRAEELSHALGVELGSTDLDLENIPSLRTLLSSCLGLVTVEASSSTVRLVHFTLHEYLLSHATLFHSPHSIIAEVCLTYLNFGCIRDFPPTVHSVPPEAPLLEYASYYWGKHAKMGMTGGVEMLALKLLDQFDKHISARLLLMRNFQGTGWGSYTDQAAGGPTGFTGLHAVVFLEIPELVDPVLDMKDWDANAADCMGSTPLTWAARGGQEEVAEVLLERQDVDPNQADNRYGRSPLSWAAGRGNDGVVRTLLRRRDLNPNQADTGYGRTPLSRAAGNGDAGVVKVLLEREDINPDQTDTEYDKSPLWWAADKGHESVVRMLLGREDVNPNQVDTEHDQTPLSRAAMNGHMGVVKMLLGRGDVNPNKVDTFDGRAPLRWALENGHEGVVNMLLEREDVNPDQIVTEHGRTPLTWAVERGQVEVVKALLGRKDSNPNQADSFYGHTPLTWAAKHGCEEVAKVLLEREEVNPDGVDSFHERTPLMWAAEAGHVSLVQMLLKREDVNPNKEDTFYGQTPLAWAAKNGHEGVAKMLLEREDVKPNQAATRGGRTPLSLAAENGHIGIVKMLLERKDLNLNQADTFYGQTPLAWAAKNGHGGVVRVLLERKDVNPSRADTKYDLIPVLWAAWKGHAEVVRVLVMSEIRAGDRGDTSDEKGVWENLRKTAHDLILATNEFDTATPAQSWSEVNNQVQKTLRAAEFGSGIIKLVEGKEERDSRIEGFKLSAEDMGVAKEVLVAQGKRPWQP